jgi:hypothetical protein
MSSKKCEPSDDARTSWTSSDGSGRFQMLVPELHELPPPYGVSSSLILLDFAGSCCSLVACVLQKERHSCPPNLTLIEILNLCEANRLLRPYKFLSFCFLGYYIIQWAILSLHQHSITIWLFLFFLCSFFFLTS